MNPPPSRPTCRYPALAGLVLAMLGLGCADQSNPVLPSSGGPGSVGTSGHLDAEASEVAAATGEDAIGTSTVTDTDASVTGCDLLKQNCQALGLGVGTGCYPVGGAGRCLPAGGVGALGSCVVGNDPPDCAPGFVCIALSNGLDAGYCLEICDTEDPTTNCGVGNACVLLPGFPKTSNAGYCQSA
jgi:hypothetical protein